MYVYIRDITCGSDTLFLIVVGLGVLSVCSVCVRMCVSMCVYVCVGCVFVCGVGVCIELDLCYVL